MHILIGAVVYADTQSDAADEAMLIFDRLTGGGPFDWHGDPTARRGRASDTPNTSAIYCADGIAAIKGK